MDRIMEKKRLLASSDSDENLDFYTHRISSKKSSFKYGFKEVIKILKNNNLDDIKKILRKQSLQLKDEVGLTALHVAAAANNTNVLKLLLEDKRCSTMINYQDAEGVTPLLAAAMVGSYDTLELLCAAGADPTKTLNKNGKNVLHVAATRRDSEAARVVLKYNNSAELVNALNDNGDTPLIEAVYVKADVVVDFLIAAGADITIQNPANGRTILHVVVAYNRAILLKRVLEHPQATTEFAEIKDMKDDSALLIAVKLNRLEMISLLLDTFQNLTGINSFEQETVFHISIRHDKCEILKVLLRSGCKICVNYADAEERTPLLYAVELDRACCVKELIEHGANYNLRNSQTGETFVHVLARTLSYSSLPYVMNITDVSWFFTQVDFEGNTPYMSAISVGNAYFLQEALKIKQVDLCDENSEGEPPIYFTAKQGHLKIMMTLLMSPRYYSFISNTKNHEQLTSNSHEVIIKSELRGDLYATDVYLLTGEIIKHPLVRWFPKALLRKTPENRNIFHACALGGNIDGLRFLYKFFNLFEPQALDDMFDHKDLMGNTPLLFAAQCGVSSISCVHFFATHGADLACVNKTGLNIFNAVLTYNPEVADSLLINLLDSCVTGRREHYYEDRLNINIKYNMLCPKEKNCNQMLVIYTLFNEMSNHDSPKGRRKVLQHPVIELFLKNKSHKHRQFILYRFLILFTVTISMSFVMPIIYVGDNSRNNNTVIAPTVQYVFITIYFLATFIPVLVKIPNLCCRTIWPTDAVSFVPFTVMTTLVCLGNTFVLAPELTAIMLLSYWIYVMVYLTTLYHTYSFQLAVFFQILNSISKHLFVLAIALFAFALSFFCIYRDDDKFSSLPASFIYTSIVLLLGFFPDVPTFEREYFTTTPVTFHFIVECVLISAFILIVILGFLNMLVGLAVRSAHVAEHDGKVYQHHHQAHVLFMVEYWCNNKLYSWLIKKGIWAHKLKKLRDSQRIQLDVGLYDDTIKDIVDDSFIRKFQSIHFQKSRIEKTGGKKSTLFGDALFSWIHDAPSQTEGNPITSETFITKQADLYAERSFTSI